MSPVQRIRGEPSRKHAMTARDVSCSPKTLTVAPADQDARRSAAMVLRDVSNLHAEGNGRLGLHARKRRVGALPERIVNRPGIRGGCLV